jgi:hypothetical protein
LIGGDVALNYPQPVGLGLLGYSQLDFERPLPSRYVSSLIKNIYGQQHKR